jgi:acetyl esterase/lipase
MSLAEDFPMTSIPCKYMVFQLLLLSGLITPAAGLAGLLPKEKPLWPEADSQNPIRYDVPESVRQHDPAKTSPSGSNRVYSFVSRPTYSIHQPTEATANGVGLVICPGGGFRELWLDREGHDLALWLKDRGFTSLVLKYRTNNELENGKRKYPPEVYEPAVVSDARQAIRILRSQAAALHLDTNRIGICGFSAGGALSAYTVFRPDAAEKQPVSGQPDFAGLFYPGLREMTLETVASAKQIPPLFIVNAIDDRLTPVDRCVDFYQSLLKAGAHAELHLYNKGGHGFDMGEGHGQSVGLWKESFLAWLKDSGFVK